MERDEYLKEREAARKEEIGSWDRFDATILLSSAVVAVLILI